jgi:ligand-binding sensor domain-containing protein
MTPSDVFDLCKLKLAWVMCVFWSLQLVPAAAQLPFFTNHTLTTGLPSNTVYYAMQDSQGFLWLATDAGVCRFDGQEFETFTPQDGLADNEIFQIKQDSRGRIWFLSFNGRISYYHHGKFFNSSHDSSLAPLNIKSLFSCAFEDSRKRMWFGTLEEGMLIRDGNTTIKFDTLMKHVRSIWEDDSYVWALIHNSIFKFDIDQPRRYTQEKIPGVGLTADASRKLWVDTTNHILYCPDRPGGMFAINYKTGESKKYESSSSVMGVSASPEGGLYVYDQLGLHHFTGEKLPEMPMLPKPSITYVYWDQNGGLWVTTLNHGLFYSPSLLLQRYVPSGPGVITRTSGYNNKVWFTCADGTYGFLDTRTKQVSEIAAIESSGNGVEEMLATTDGAWIGLNPGGITKLRASDQLKFIKGLSVKSFSINNDSIFVSAGPAGLRKYHIESLPEEDMNRFNSVTTERCFAVHVDRRGRTWYGTQAGLHVADRGKSRNISQLHPYLQNRIQRIREDADGNIWVMVESTALLRISKDLKVTLVVDQQNGLRGLQCRQFVFGQQNDLWFISHNVLGNISIIDDRVVVRSVLRFGSESLNDLWSDADGLYLATNDGLIVVPHGFESQNGLRIAITGFYVDKSQRVNHGPAPAIIPSGHEDYRITFSSVSFTGRTNQYRYLLQQRDTSWSYTSSTELEFPVLEPGQYHFRVQALRNDGSWSPSADVQFFIEEPIWQRWWFYLVAITIAFLIALLIVRRSYSNKVRRLVLQEKLLDSELKALTAQMNPHFIANTLNTIQRYFISHETRIANKLLSRFGTLMRTTLENTAKAVVTLEEEISFLKNYLEIEQARFSKKFGYEIIIDESLDPALQTIPSMIIQPFVENAIIHGFASAHESYTVTISFHKNNDGLLVIVDDNGVGRDPVKKQPHISRGVSLIRERLAVLSAKNKRNYRLTIIDKNLPDQGTRIELDI